MSSVDIHESVGTTRHEILL